MTNTKILGATVTPEVVTYSEENNPNYTSMFTVEGFKVVVYHKYVGSVHARTYLVNINGGIKKFYTLKSLVPAVLEFQAASLELRAA